MSLMAPSSACPQRQPGYTPGIRWIMRALLVEEVDLAGAATGLAGRKNKPGEN